MNKHFHWPKRVLLFCVGLCSCSLISHGKVNFDLKIVQKVSDAPGVFEESTYRFPLEGAFVLSGAYTGLALRFSKKAGDSTQSLVFEFPSIKKMLVTPGYWSISPLPLTLTQEDFQGLESDVVKEVKPYFFLAHSVPRSKDTYHTDHFHFSRFSITFKEFSIKKDRLTLKATFEGVMDEYEIHGTMTLSNVPLIRNIIE